MKRFKRRIDRPDPARRRPGAVVESLEARELMTSGIVSASYYQPTTLLPLTVDKSSPALSVAHPIATSSPQQLARLEGQGKLLTGKDRQGDEWQITVHGPGSVIVTDATPNDGVFDDDLDTIQLVGTSLTQTYVTGEVSASARVTNSTTGIILFDHLIAQDGVKSIILNGFTLARTVAPDGVPEVFLPGGVQYLSFQNIEAPLDLASNPSPFNLIIGDPSTPSLVAPTIKLGSIQNTVFNSTLSATNGVPQTVASVNLVVNGDIRGLDIVSVTQAPPANATQQQEFPIVGTTGRTSIQATGVGHLKVKGSAVNTTVSRTPQPFQHGFSGVSHVTTAEFGGTADAVGIDATNGTIKHLRFLRGLGNPTGSGTAATSYGVPDSQRGYASFGLSGGTVTAKHIGRLTAGAANLTRQTPLDPDLIQVRRQGSTVYFTRPGNALTNATIVASKSIGRTTIVGNSQNSEIRSGYHYPSFIAGLEPVRAASHIGKVRQRGSLVNSVVAASYRPGVNGGKSVAGPGLIVGNLSGTLASVPGATTALGDSGTGFFAKTKVGYLPPPSAPTTTPGGVLLPQQSNKTPNVLLKP